jgi:hypothetical protein
LHIFILALGEPFFIPSQMKKFTQYTLIPIFLLVFVTSCHRQLARVQRTPAPSYQTLLSAADKAQSQIDVPQNANQPVANSLAVVEQPPVVQSEIVASTKPSVDPNHKLAKKMVRIQKLLSNTVVTDKKASSSKPQTRIKKIAADHKGTLGLLGLIFGVGSLLLLYCTRDRLPILIFRFSGTMC